MSDPMFWIQTGIAALIAFGATFSGVYLSFRKESRRRQAEEKNQFARILKGVSVESATNHAMLNSIKSRVLPGKAFSTEPLTDALQAALSDPMFHRWADHSLVAAAQIVRIQLASINNVLLMHREAATAGHGMSHDAATELRIRAETIQEVVDVFQELLEETMSKFGAAVVADERIQKIDQRLAEIMGGGARRMEEAAKVDTRTVRNAEGGG